MSVSRGAAGGGSSAGLYVRRTRSWTEEASRLIAQGEEATASPEVLLASYRNCLQKLKQECEWLSLKVTAVEHSNNAQVVNKLISKELNIANQQWEEKLELLRQEFRSNFDRICKCANLESYKCSKCAQQLDSKLKDLSDELKDITQQYDQEKRNIASEFERKLQLILDEQFDCRVMIEGDNSLGDGQKSAILSQLQELHNSELDSVIGKYDLQLNQEKEKVEKLEFEILELQSEEKGIEEDLRRQIESLEKENFLLKEENTHLKSKNTSILNGTNEDQNIVKTSSGSKSDVILTTCTTESGIASGTPSQNVEERLPLMTSSSVASIYSSLSPLGLILPSCSSGYPTSHISSSSFSERDFHLKNKLDQVARRVKFGLPLSDSAWDSFSVSSFNMRDLEVALAASFTPGVSLAGPIASTPRDRNISLPTLDCQVTPFARDLEKYKHAQENNGFETHVQETNVSVSLANLKEAVKSLTQEHRQDIIDELLVLNRDGKATEQASAIEGQILKNASTNLEKAVEDIDDLFESQSNERLVHSQEESVTVTEVSQVFNAPVDDIKSGSEADKVHVFYADAICKILSDANIPFFKYYKPNETTQDSKASGLALQDNLEKLGTIHGTFISLKTQIDSFQSYKEDFAKQLASLTQEKETLLNEYNSMEHQLAVYIRDKHHFENETIRLNEENKSVCESLKASQTETDRLGDEIKVLNELVTKKESEASELSKELEIIKQQLGDIETENARLAEKMDPLQEQLYVKDSENDELADDVKRLKEIIQDQEIASAKITKEISSLHERLNGKEIENFELAREIQSLKKKVEVKENETVQLADKLESSTELLGVKETENAQLVEKIQSLNVDLSDQEAYSAKLSEEIIVLKDTKDNKETKVALIEEKLELLNEQLSKKEAEHEKLTEEIRTLNETQEAKEDENLKLAETLGAINEDLGTKNTEVSQLAENLTTLNHQLAIREAENTKLANEVKELSELLTIKESDLMGNSTKLQSLIAEFDATRESFAELSANFENQKLLLEKLNLEKSELSTKNEDLNATCLALENCRNNAETTALELKNSLHAKTLDLTTLNDQYSKMVNKLDDSLVLVDRFQNEVKVLNGKIRAMEQQMVKSEQIDNFAQTESDIGETSRGKLDNFKVIMHDGIEEQLVRLLVQNAISDAVLDQKADQIRKLLKNFQEIQESSHVDFEKLSSELKISEAKIDSLEAEKKGLESNLESFKVDVENSVATIANKDSEINDLKQRLTTVESLKDEFQKNNDFLVDDNNELKAKIDELENEKSTLNEMTNLYRSEILGLQTDLTETKESEKALNEKVIALTSEAENLKEVKVALQVKCKRYEDQIEEFSDEIAKLTQKNLSDSEIIENIKFENKTLSEELDLKIQNFLALEKLKEISEAENFELKEKIESLYTENVKQKEAITSLEVEISNLKNVIEIARSEKETLEAQITDLEKSVAIKEEENQILCADCEKLKKTLTDLNCEKERYSEQQNAMRNDFEEQKAHLLTKIEELDSESFEKRDQIDAHLKGANNEVSALKESHSASEEKIKELEQEKLKRDKVITLFEEEKITDQLKIVNLESENDNLKQEIKGMEHDIGQKEHKSRQLEESLELIQLMKCEKAMVDEKILSYQNDIDILTNENHEMNVSFKIFEENIQSLEVKCEGILEKVKPDFESDCLNDSDTSEDINFPNIYKLIESFPEVLESKCSEIGVLKDEIKRLTEINDSLVLESLENEGVTQSSNTAGLKPILEDNVLNLNLTDLDQESPTRNCAVDNQKTYSRFPNEEESRSDSSKSAVNSDDLDEDAIDRKDVHVERVDVAADVSTKNYVTESPIFCSSETSNFLLAATGNENFETVENENCESVERADGRQEMKPKTGVFSIIDPNVAEGMTSFSTPFVDEVLKASPRKRLCGNEACNREVLKLMTKFDEQMANQSAICERRAREIAELNELVNLLQKDLNQTRKQNEDIVVEHDAVVDVLDQVAKEQMDTLRILTSHLSNYEPRCANDEATNRNTNQSETPTHDVEDPSALTSARDDVAGDSRRFSSLGLMAASQLACVAGGLRATRFRTADEIANWDMESLSRSPFEEKPSTANATCGSIDLSFHSNNNEDNSADWDTRSATPAGSSTGRTYKAVSGGNRVRRRSVGLARNLTQYTIENTEGLLGDVMLHKVVLSSSQELKSCAESLLQKLTSDVREKETRLNEHLKLQTTKVLTDVHVAVNKIVNYFTKILLTLFPKQTFQTTKYIRTLKEMDNLYEDGNHEEPQVSPGKPLDNNANEVDGNPTEGLQDRVLKSDVPLSPSKVGNPVILMETLECIKMDLAMHESDIKELKGKTELLSGLELSHDELKEDLIRKSDEISRLQEEMDELLTRNKEQGMALENLKHKMTELSEFKAKLVAEKVELEEAIDRMRQKNDGESLARVEDIKRQNEHCLREVLGELSVIKTSIGEKDSQIQRLKGEIVILSEKLSDHLADELTRDQIDSASQELTLEDSLSRLTALVDKNSQAILKFKSQEVILEKLQISNAQLIELVDNKTTKIGEMELKLEDVDSIYATLEQRNQEFSDLKQKMEDENNYLHGDIEKLKVELKQAEENMTDNDLRHQETVEFMGKQIEELQISLQDRDEKITRVQTKLDSLVEWFNNSRSKPERRKSLVLENEPNERLDVEVPNLSAIGDIDHPIAVTIEMLKQSIEENRKEIIKYEGSNEKFEAIELDNKRLRSEMEANLEELQRLKSEVDQFARNNEKLKSMCEKFEDQQTQFEVLKSELEHDKEAAIVSLDSAKRALEEEQRGRAEVTERSHVDISGLKDQIEQLRDELLLSQKYVSELSLIRDNHEENSKLLEQELNAKLQQKESTIRTLQTTNQGLKETNLQLTSDKSDLKSAAESLKRECDSLEKRCAQVEQERLKIKTQYEQALRSLCIPPPTPNLALQSPIELPSKEKMRDDSTMLLLQTPNRLSLGESPVVDAKSHSTQFSRPAETTKSTLSPISDSNEADGQNANAEEINVSNESEEIYHSFNDENEIELDVHDGGNHGPGLERGSSRNRFEDAEKMELMELNQSLKDFIVQCNNLSAQALDMTSKNDWRLDLLKCVQNIFMHEQQLITNEARTLEDKINQSHSSKSSTSTELKKCREELEKLNKRVERLTKVIQEGVSQIRVADRVSLINEVKDLKKRLNSKSSSGSRKGSSSEEPKGRSQDSSIVPKLEQKVQQLESELREQQVVGCDLNTRLRLESGRCEEATDQLKKLSRELNKLRSDHHPNKGGVEGDPNATYRLNETEENREIGGGELNHMREVCAQLEKNLDQEKQTVRDLKREVNKEREKSTAFEAEADMHKNYANEIMSELNHLEQKTVYELNDKLTSLQTQLKASENNLWEKNRAFNIARNTISDLTNQLESSKFELGETRTNNLQLDLRCKNLEKSEKEMARRLQVKESEMKSMERSLKLAQNRCNDMECSRDSRVSKLEREADTREGQLEEARADKARLQRQVDSISEQVDTCKLHIQKLTLSKESNEAERQNLFALIEEQKLAITKLEKETLNLKASRGHSRSASAQPPMNSNLTVIQAEKEDSLDSETGTYVNNNSNVENVHNGNDVMGPDDVTDEDHVSAFQQHVESVRANVQIALTRYLEAVHVFQSHGNKDGFMLETKHILTHGKECLDQIQQIAEKYVIMPTRISSRSLLSLNEKLIQQNRDLTDVVSLLTNERIALQRKVDECNMKSNCSQSTELQLQKVYASFLRADSRRKNLLYQKRYLLLLIEGFRSYEDSALRMISEMGLLSADTFTSDLTSGSLLCRNVPITPYRRLKGAVRAVMAVWRMKQLVFKWRHICNPTIPKHIPATATHMSTAAAAAAKSLSQSSLSVYTDEARGKMGNNSSERITCGSGRTWNVKHGSNTRSGQPQQSLVESVALSNTSHCTYTKSPQSGPAINQQSKRGGHNQGSQNAANPGFWVPATCSESNEETAHKGQTEVKVTKGQSGKGQKKPNSNQPGGHSSEHNRTGSGDFEDPLVSRYRNRLTEMQHKLSSINSDLGKSNQPQQGKSSTHSPQHKR